MSLTASTVPLAQQVSLYIPICIYHVPMPLSIFTMYLTPISIYLSLQLSLSLCIFPLSLSLYIRPLPILVCFPVSISVCPCKYTYPICPHYLFTSVANLVHFCSCISLKAPKLVPICPLYLCIYLMKGPEEWEMMLRFVKAWEKKLFKFFLP